MSPRYRLSPILRALGACDESLVWLEREQHTSFCDAIDACPHHDWLLWLVGRTCDRRQIASLACDLAEPSLRHGTDPRPAACIATVRAWLRGDASLGDVQVAREHAADAASSVDARVDARAAHGAYAACSASAHASAGHASAAGHASSVAYVTAASAYVAARSSSLAKSRDIIRAAVDWSAVERRLVELGRAYGALVEVSS